MVEFECKKCKKNFSSKRNLKNHLEKNVCIYEKMFSCGICGIEYKKRWNLRCHILTHGINKGEISNFIKINKNENKKIDETSTCPFCEKEFSSLKTLKKHIKNNCLGIKIESEIKNNYINNGTINNITNNNITYNLNINIKPFGEEKIDSTKLIEILESVNIFNKEDLVKRVIKEKHINTPENRNVFVNYKFGKIAVVLDKKDMKWKKYEKDDVYNKIRCNIIDDIDDCLYSNNKQNILISNEIKKLHTNDKKNNKKYYNDVNNLFFNNKNILEKSYKNQVSDTFEL